MSVIFNNKEGISWAKIYLFTTITYVFSHFLMLLIYGAWWDDMLIWNISPELAQQRYEIFNNPFVYFLRSAIFTIEDMTLMTFVCRLVPFVCWFVSVSAFLLVVKKLTGNKRYTLYSSLIVASCGLNKCMFLMSCYHYTISISLFMIGLVYFVNDYYKSKSLYKLLTALFWTLSLLVWRSAVLVIPMTLVLAVFCQMKIELKSKCFYVSFIKILFRQYWIIIVGFLVFAVLYKTVLAPQGEYSTYYKVGLLDLLLSPLTTLTSSFSLILGYISNLLSVFSTVGTLGYKIVVFIALFIFFVLLFYRHFSSEIVSKKYLWIALFFLYFSILPHLLMDVTFGFDINGYKTRIAALSVFPISMIIAYFVTQTKDKWPLFIISGLLSLSVMNTWFTYFDYSKGWVKNEAIANFFRQNDLNGKKIVVIDNAQDYSPFEKETYRDYDYEGCARLAYGVYSSTKCFDYYTHNTFEDIDLINPDFYLNIDLINPASNIVGIKGLLYLYLNKEKYDEMVSNLLKFRLVPYSEFESNLSMKK